MATVIYKEEYINMIIRDLLRKVYCRKYGSKVRASIVPKSFYSAYKRDNCSLERKHELNEAIAFLEGEGFLSVIREDYSSDVRKAYLERDREEDFFRFASSRGIPVRENACVDAMRLKDTYGGIDKRIDARIRSMISEAKKNPFAYDINRRGYEDLLRAAVFIVGNKRNLYIREASALIFGDTKILEKQYENKLLSLFGEDTLEPFNIKHTDTLIRMRGNITIHFSEFLLDVRKFPKGIVISKEDIDTIAERIEVCEPVLMTVENETSFLRHLPDGVATMFLSGFASSAQIAVIKRVIRDNPGIEIWHFGDIDAGGLRILNHLKKNLGEVKPYHMDLEDLRDSRYECCLKPLENDDRKNLELLKNEQGELIAFMLDRGAKLEQEIISLNLDEERDKGTTENNSAVLMQKSI